MWCWHVQVQYTRIKSSHFSIIWLSDCVQFMAIAMAVNASKHQFVFLTLKCGLAFKASAAISFLFLFFFVVVNKNTHARRTRENIAYFYLFEVFSVQKKYNVWFGFYDNWNTFQMCVCYCSLFHWSLFFSFSNGFCWPRTVKSFSHYLMCAMNIISNLLSCQSCCFPSCIFLTQTCSNTFDVCVCFFSAVYSPQNRNANKPENGIFIEQRKNTNKFH